MTRIVKTKQKSFYMLKALMEKSDKDHRLSTDDLIEIVESHGLSIERKSIYDDVETWRSLGIDICHIKEKPSGYYIGKRMFEPAELKMLVDMVQISKGISVKKSEELINKLSKLAGEHIGRDLQRNVRLLDRVKTLNESLMDTIDCINEAVISNSQISFVYYRWTTDRKLVAKNDGRTVTVSPWILNWDDENYYLVGYDEKAGIPKHYRVDKMGDVKVLYVPREGMEMLEEFDPADFSKATFGMFGGSPEEVTLLCSNSLIGPVIDRFGTDIIVAKADDEHFLVTRRINVSDQFFGWLTALGPGVVIHEPDSVRERFKDHLEKMRLAQGE